MNSDSGIYSCNHYRDEVSQSNGRIRNRVRKGITGKWESLINKVIHSKDFQSQKEWQGRGGNPAIPMLLGRITTVWGNKFQYFEDTLIVRTIQKWIVLPCWYCSTRDRMVIDQKDGLSILASLWAHCSFIQLRNISWEPGITFTLDSAK